MVGRSRPSRLRSRARWKRLKPMWYGPTAETRRIHWATSLDVVSRLFLRGRLHLFKTLSPRKTRDAKRRR